VVIDGVRSNAEIEVLKKIATVKLLSIHASTNTRYSFLTTRKRSDDPQDRNTFDERDNREISVGISASIALADETISNNNLTIDQLIDTTYEIIQKWLK
jgi:dephospho-CoA kinase